MKIYAFSFASKKFISSQIKQKESFIKAGFSSSDIFIYGPEQLGIDFYNHYPNASESNSFGWFSFKPYLLMKILSKIDEGDLLFYLDVNDKPLIGIKEYLQNKFKKNRFLDILVPATNYPNINFLSKFHKKNFSFELLFSSLINMQPEAGAIIIKNSYKTKSILKAWYFLTLLQANEFNKNNRERTRHDQETLFIMSRIYNSIKLESWYKFKLTGQGLRNYIKFEYFRKN